MLGAYCYKGHGTTVFPQNSASPRLFRRHASTLVGNSVVRATVVQHFSGATAGCSGDSQLLPHRSFSLVSCT